MSDTVDVTVLLRRVQRQIRHLQTLRLLVSDLEKATDQVVGLVREMRKDMAEEAPGFEEKTEEAKK